MYSPLLSYLVPQLHILGPRPPKERAFAPSLRLLVLCLHCLFGDAEGSIQEGALSPALECLIVASFYNMSCARPRSLTSSHRRCSPPPRPPQDRSFRFPRRCSARPPRHQGGRRGHPLPCFDSTRPRWLVVAYIFFFSVPVPASLSVPPPRPWHDRSLRLPPHHSASPPWRRCERGGHLLPCP